jgi:dTDP-4-amino-4,6-dideoxygalactose transaminase
LYVIEDCAHAHGTRYQGRPIGFFGHINAWSFCHDIVMSTGGEGGMVTTNDNGLWDKAWSYKDYGKSYDAVFNRKHPIGFFWLHESFGTNGRLTEVQSAIGRILTKQTHEWSRKRKVNSNLISVACSRFSSLRVPQNPDYIVHASYKHYVLVGPDQLKSGCTRDRIMNEIIQLGVPCYTGGCPEVYLEKVFDGTDFRPDKRLPIAKELGVTSLMFLVHPTLKDSEIKKTCEVIEQVTKMASFSSWFPIFKLFDFVRTGDKRTDYLFGG